MRVRTVGRMEGSRRGEGMSKRWQQRPAGSTWGDWGDDDELGRINLLTPQKVLQGVREVEAGISFCLSLPLDFPGGTALNQRRYPPVVSPTEDMDGNPDTFYNVPMRTMDKFGDPKYVDVLGRRRGDPLPAVLDAVGFAGPRRAPSSTPTATAAWRRRVYYNGQHRAGVDLVGPQAGAAGDGGGHHRCFAKHLGLEHHGRRRRAGSAASWSIWPTTSRARLAGGGPQDAREEIMAADNVVVEPGDMLLLHTGFATRDHRRSGTGNPDPVKIHTLCSYLDARDESLLEVDRRLADLGGVGGGQLRVPWRAWSAKDRDPSRHSFLPIHHLCLFKPRCPARRNAWYLHELATWLRAHNRSRFLLTAPPLRLPGIVEAPR